jgi:hypothetical protein
MRRRIAIGSGGLAALTITSLLMVSGVFAATGKVNLGTASNFSVLAGTTVTSIPPTTMNAELGLSPGSSVTGAPSASATHIDDSAAVKAKADLGSAYTQAAAEPATQLTPNPGVIDVSGKSFTPGVYKASSAILLASGSVTLNAEGNPNAVFVFQMASTLKTASGTSVVLENGAQACNVYWQVGSSATLGTNSTFVGTIMALTSITSTTGVHVNGRLLAENGAVTLDSNTITTSQCSGATTTTPTTQTTPTKPGSPPVTPPVGITNPGGGGTPGCGCGPGTSTGPAPVAGSGSTSYHSTFSGAGRCHAGRECVLRVTGSHIAKVVFYRNGKIVGTESKAPYAIKLKATTSGVVYAKVTYTDSSAVAVNHARECAKPIVVECYSKSAGVQTAEPARKSGGHWVFVLAK